MTVGVLGGGQLGRMLALAGYPLGLRFRFFDQNPEAPAGQVGELIVGDFGDRARLDAFATGLEVLTYEFENVPVAAVEHLGRRVRVFPPPGALRVCQDRMLEKDLFKNLEIDTPAFAPVSSRAELLEAIERLGTPAVLKTRSFGYDGKGQAVIRSGADAERAWTVLGASPLILEAFVPFEREVSIIAVRGRNGEHAFYPLTQNRHEGGILRESIAPAPNSGDLQPIAEDFARRVLDALDYTGVLAIEFFVLQGHLIANEIAPRVHNSGHWTMDGAQTGQFENHLRAVLGLALGPTGMSGGPLACAGMLNLIGAAPTLEELSAIPGAKVHLYGKEPRPGRKIGHVNFVDASERGLLAKTNAARSVVERAAS